MTYVVESGASSSRRSRRIRAAITLLIVALMLFFAFWYAYSYYRSDPRAEAQPAPCPTASPSVPVAVPSKTLVNVYNATDRSGLAAATAEQLKKRGFVVDKVANDPRGRTVAGSAEVRFGDAGKAQARLVLTTVAGAKAAKDDRKGESVDLVLGEKYRSLAAAASATPPSAAAPTCRP